MRRRFRILLMGAVLGAAIAVPSTVMASGFAGLGDTWTEMPGHMGGEMGMMSQMRGPAEDHEEMMQQCEAHIAEGHEGMMDEMGGMGMMDGMGMMR